MVRATNAPAARKRHKKVLKEARGFRGARSRSYKAARETLIRAMAYSYRDRRVRKRDFRQLWITRIGIAAKLNDMSYSTFIHGLIKADIQLNRKVLADIAVRDAAGFAELVKAAKAAA